MKIVTHVSTSTLAAVIASVAMASANLGCTNAVAPSTDSPLNGADASVTESGEVAPSADEADVADAFEAFQALNDTTPTPEASDPIDAKGVDSALDTSAKGPRPIPDPLYGVTIDGITPLPSIVTSLSKLSHMPTTRVVFDEFQKASTYTTSVAAIYDVSFVMGAILDSYYVKDYSIAAYGSRTTEYLDAMSKWVDIWEVGNEINGEWLGTTSDVTAKMTGAFDLVTKRNLRTALTLYYNATCYSLADHEMFVWANANIPPGMKSGLDYVLVSYYEDDCPGAPPDWNAVFAKLAAMFPKSKIGFGECGTLTAKNKSEFITRYYTMSVAAPRYIGGYFWWYFRQDMVPSTQPLWAVLNAAIK
ncbi:MAG: hypothetical protein NVS3B20_04670 [Polyangiales bacterium]